MNPFEMVVMIVAIVMVASIVKTRIRARHGIVNDKLGERFTADPETTQAKAEIAQLKERIAVLERLATDNNSALNLDREIEKLR